MRQNKVYLFTFVIAVSAISALVLASASSFLKDRQKRNREIDIKKNILHASGMKFVKKTISDDECSDVEKCYANNISSFVIDYSGKKIESKVTPEFIDLQKEFQKPEEERVYPVFLRKKGDEEVAYCFPVAGKGLWGSIYGFMALEKDMNTVKGLTFYSHSETPGLGAEIEASWFLDNFRGKKILNKKGELVFVSIVKGKLENPEEEMHRVDGISGATLTSASVSKILENCISIYEPYFRMLRKRTVPVP